jgi:hypothetical protein
MGIAGLGSRSVLGSARRPSRSIRRTGPACARMGSPCGTRSRVECSGPRGRARTGGTFMESSPGRSIVGPAGSRGAGGIRRARARLDRLGSTRDTCGSFACHRRPVVGSPGRRCACTAAPCMGSARARMGGAPDRGARRSGSPLVGRPGRPSARAPEAA